MSPAKATTKNVNEGMNDIKSVFEGVCHMLQVKPVVQFCISLMDRYVAQLVQLVSSQLNPDVICSVIGICGKSVFRDMIEKAHQNERMRELQVECDSCLDFSDFIGQKLEKYTEKDVKSYLRERCRSFGSFSDSCANIIDAYGDDICRKLKKEFVPSSLCYISGSCVNGYTRRVHVKTESDVGVIQKNSDAISAAVKHLSDAQTCDLCRQLVKHLKEILVSNTTESEFKLVIKGICKQLGRFRSECLDLADEYYDQIYYYILHNLNETAVCRYGGLCPMPGVFVNGPFSPMLPTRPIPIKDEKAPLGRVSVAKPDAEVKVFSYVAQPPVKVEISYGDPLESKFQLPIERVGLPHLKDLDVNNREACVFCQYFLHYIQKVISQPYGERELKTAVEKVCRLMPDAVSLKCKNFVEEFGDAFVAILAQEIDPSQVCPSLHICPARVVENKFEPLEIGGKPGCPLCLLAIEDISEKLKNNKTEDAIRKALLSLCVRMPTNLKSQCDEFVNKYTDQVIDMLVADFTPQEVCAFLKLCHPNGDVELVVPLSEEREEILTNEIPQNRVEDHVDITKKTPPMCFLCEYVMDKIKENLGDNQTKEEIEDIVSGVCLHMPKPIVTDCNNFVDRYGKYVVDMLLNRIDPVLVCNEMHMCREKVEQTELRRVHQAVEECALCEALVGAIRALLEDPEFDRNVSRYATRICYSIPRMRHDQIEKCVGMVMSYGPSIVNLLVEFEMRPGLICPRIGLCDSAQQTKVDVVDSTVAVEPTQRTRPLIGVNRCTRGPTYWCANEENAKECKALHHCREMVWKAEKPRTTPAA